MTCWRPCADDLSAAACVYHGDCLHTRLQPPLDLVFANHLPVQEQIVPSHSTSTQNGRVPNSRIASGPAKNNPSPLLCGQRMLDHEASASKRQLCPPACFTGARFIRNLRWWATCQQHRKIGIAVHYFTHIPAAVQSCTLTANCRYVTYSKNPLARLRASTCCTYACKGLNPQWGLLQQL